MKLTILNQTEPERLRTLRRTHRGSCTDCASRDDSSYRIPLRPANATLASLPDPSISENARQIQSPDIPNPLTEALRDRCRWAATSIPRLAREALERTNMVTSAAKGVYRTSSMDEPWEGAIQRAGEALALDPEELLQQGEAGLRERHLVSIRSGG